MNNAVTTVFKNFIAFCGGLAAVLIFAGISFAATSVRLEQPKTPTNQNNFNLVFVALDSGDNAVTVTCYKKGPSDGAFAQFGSPITLSNGGNTDNCPVDSSIVNTNGTYAFYVMANGTQSNTVTVDYNTSGPGTPSEYSKDHPSSCQYKISFKTADDSGKTVKVELYRSVNTSFNADSGSRSQTMGIGSNTSATFTDTVPDCNTTYYYAIRAFDSAGNGSGLVGDSQTVTTVITPTGTPQAASQANGAIPVVTNNVTQGEPTGTQPSVAPTTGEKGVLGAKTSPQESFTSLLIKYGGWAIIILGLFAAAFFFFRRQAKRS